VVSEAVIAGIHYHALAVRLPNRCSSETCSMQIVEPVAARAGEQIQFFRASGQMAGRSRSIR
jgi:hypothetical protein